MSRRDRMLRTSNISTPESGQDPLESREPEARAMAPSVDSLPRPSDLHWLDLWRAGAQAALDCDTVAEARALTPPEGTACRDCWAKGQSTAVKAMEAASE